MLYPMRGAALPRRRYTSPYNGSPAYGLLEALNRPELVGEPGSAEPTRVPISALPDLWAGSLPPGSASRQPAVSPRSATPSRRIQEDDDALPDSVVTMFRDGLDADGLRFLKFGPRTPAERLAFSQRVGSDAHIDATPAPENAQVEFQTSGTVDQTRHFVGPDGAVYRRIAGMEEPLPARLRRGMEGAVGGFAAHTIEQSLADINRVSGGTSDDALIGDDGTDVLDEHVSGVPRYDPATLAKIADVQAFDPPQSDYQLAVRDFLRAQRINPASWRTAEPLPEYAQKTFRENGYEVWPAIVGGAFAGPDGVLYYKNEFTPEDPVSAKYRILDSLEQRAKAAEEPPPDPWDVYWKAVAAGQFLPGAHYRGTLPPAFRGQAPQVVPTQPVQPVPNRQQRGGRRGSPETRTDLEQQL